MASSVAKWIGADLTPIWPSLTTPVVLEPDLIFWKTAPRDVSPHCRVLRVIILRRRKPAAERVLGDVDGKQELQEVIGAAGF
jgi:hypothetical protein